MRKDTRKTDLIIIIVILLLVLTGILWTLLSKHVSQDSNASSNGGTKTLADYNGKPIGILIGSSFEAITLQKFPDSKYLYFNSYPDLSVALLEGRIDGFVADEPVLMSIHAENPEISYLPEDLEQDAYHFIFNKTEEKSQTLLKQFNDTLDELISDGTLKKLQDLWLGNDDDAKVIDRSHITGENGTIAIGTNSTTPPFNYIADGELKGLSVDLIYRFARKYGYSLKFEDTDVTGMLSGLTAGKYDMCINSFSKTPEREKTIDFSNPFFYSSNHLAVRTKDVSNTSNDYGTNKIDASTPLSYFRDKKIGILTGSSYESTTLKLFPDAEYLYFDIASDLTLATQTGKIDGFLMSMEQAETMIAENKGLLCLNEYAEEIPFAFAFPKTTHGGALRDEVNEFLGKIKKDGTMDKLLKKWSNGDLEQAVDLTGFTGEKGVLRIASDGTTPPWEFTYNGELTGYEIELIATFCREYGYKPEFETMTFSAIIPAIVSEKYDMAAANVAVTAERAESVYFSDQESNAIVVFVASGQNPQKGSSGRIEDRPFSYYAENKKIGAITGGLYEVMIRERFPDAEILQYNNQPDMAVALSAGIIDAFTCPESTAKDFMKEDPSLTYLKEVFMEIPYGFAFEKSKGKEQLRDEMNEFLKKLHADGTYDEIVAIWFGDDESKKTVDASNLTGENGRIRYITAPTMQPFSYVANGKNVGLEVDLVTRFCREYGYSLTIDNAEFASLIPGIASGMYDVASGTIMITKERAESVNFSDVYYTANAVVVVRSEEEEAAAKPGFFEGLSDSFEKNFIRENRWQLIVSGIGTTCLITLFATLFGSILSFLICLFRRTGSKLANIICNVYVKVLQGTPLVVLLMILYYVILGKSGLPGVWVAILGFSLNFGAYASEIMRSGIESIDGGQLEAALALGYTENQAFYRFIFPQAAVRFLPVYNGEIISLLKSTSIVGYIAIQDLTKMSDIIRSRTYEAFFPLIVTAIIYFILAWIISILLKFILKQISPKRKRR